MMDFGVRGQRLWESLLERDTGLTDELNPDREVAITACRTADRVEVLEQGCLTVEPVLERFGASPMAHPMYVEIRHQAALLARLVAALRLPDLASGKKPERRTLRGTQQPSALSALDRARNKAAG